MKPVFAALCILLLIFPSLGAGQKVYELLARTPDCAVPCILQQFEEGNCSITDIANITDCACTNITLLAGLSNCVQASCSFIDQGDSALVLDDLCVGYPKESRQYLIVAWAVSSIALTSLFTVLRCISRYIVTSGLWWDDWLIIVAAISLIALCSIQIAETRIALGLHYWNINPANAVLAFQLFYSAQVTYILVQVTSKVAILLLFWRIFPNRHFRRIVWGCIIFLVAHGFVFLGLVIFQCSPIRSVWDKTIPSTCMGLKAISAAGAALAILEDVVILVLPVGQVFQLQLTYRKKLAVCFMFSIGSFACVTSMVRLKYVVTYKYDGDYTWYNVEFFIWCMIELASAVICGCLPTLRPLMKKVFGSMGSIKGYWNSRSTKTDSSWVGGSHGEFGKLPEPPQAPGQTHDEESTPPQTPIPTNALIPLQDSIRRQTFTPPRIRKFLYLSRCLLPWSRLYFGRCRYVSKNPHRWSHSCFGRPRCPRAPPQLQSFPPP
ncbi:integral membrane protein [Plectosphaerella cucumerina]|uniref:Integral membrane protein n=1 Tax=Plectosphaerella cucumerina TaxID=40658 RepID=A0A8K0T8A1_9PEZI|nr:integral membrane protein [Plectosphaerella cucumerina]